MRASRMASVALVVVLALLVATAQPAAASTMTVVASTHSTDSDFASGSLSGNAVIEGTGESATVALGTTAGGSETFTYTGSEQTWDVPTGVFSLDVELLGAGVEHASQNGGYVEGELPVSDGETLFYYVGGQGGRPDGGWNGGGDGDTTSGNGGTATSGGGAGATDIRRGGNDLGDREVVAGGAGGAGDSSHQNSDFADMSSTWTRGGDGGADQGEDAPDATQGGTTATGGEGGDQSSGGPGGSGSVDGEDGSLGLGGNGSAQTYDSDDGGIVLASGGGGGGYHGGGAGALSHDGTVNPHEGAASGGAAGSNYVGGLSSTVSNTRGGGNTGHGQINVSWSETTQSTYVSPNHTVEDSTGGFVNIVEVDNASATVTFEGWDGSQWVTLDETTGITTNGNHSFSWATSSATKVRLTVTSTAQTGHDSSVLRFDSEGVTITDHEPSIDDESGSPTGDLSSSTPTLSVNVTDPEFGKATHEEVTVVFEVDGTEVGTDTLSSNGTASVTTTISTGGDHSWSATATDNYGLSTTSDADPAQTGDQPYSIRVPSTLYIRPVDDPTALLNETDISATVTLVPQGESEDIRIEENVTDGTVDLSGMPVTGRIIAQVTEENHHTRSALIPSIYHQQSIYMLNKSESSVSVTFELQDNTGQYEASSSYLVVRRPLDTGDGTTSWQAVTGDGFDATGSFQTTLQPDVRYQLIVENEAGDSQVLGYYDPPNQETVEPLPIGRVSISSQVEQEGWVAGAEMKDVDGTTTVGYRFFDPGAETDSLTIRVFNRTGGGNETEIYNASYSGPIRSQAGSISLPGHPVDGDYRVEFEADRNGEVVVESVDVGDVTAPPITDVIDDGVGLVVGLSAIVLAGLVVVTSSSSAAVITATIVAFVVSMFGLVPIHPVQIGVAGTIGLVYHFGRK